MCEFLVLVVQEIFGEQNKDVFFYLLANVVFLLVAIHLQSSPKGMCGIIWSNIIQVKTECIDIEIIPYGAQTSLQLREQI